MSQLMVFLDDGGVMNGNGKRAVQWQRLISEFFVQLLGGSSETWMEANRIVSDRLFNPDKWRVRIEAAADYANFDRNYQVDWLREMCEFVSVATPSEEESIELARRAAAYITRHVDAAFPGAVEAIGM